MGDIIITRLKDNGKQTTGRLIVPNTDFACKTLELSWKSNENNISCIPPEPQGVATYEWERLEQSPSFPYPHLWIKDVPNRSYIKIHRGNYNRQILGCILVGDGLTDIDGDGNRDTTNSTQTLKKLLSKVGDSGTIKIISVV